jgi:hypothetical protein
MELAWRETAAGLLVVVAIFGLAFLEGPVRDDILWVVLAQVLAFGAIVFLIGVQYGRTRAGTRG